MISKMRSSMAATHSSACFNISFPQKWITAHPMSRSALSTALSLAMFRSIFFIQYSLFSPRRCFLCSQSYPWKNSLSQKMAILYFLNTMSGVPGSDLSFLRYLCPLCQRAFLKAISIAVSLPLIRLMALLLFSGAIGAMGAYPLLPLAIGGLYGVPQAALRPSSRYKSRPERHHSFVAVAPRDCLAHR